MNSIVLITGATSGIGLACARKFASSDRALIITGRRQDRLDAISHELKSMFGIQVLPLCFDVRNKAEVDNLLGNLPDTWDRVDILINNAGLVLGRDPLMRADMDDWDTMLDTNVHGLLYVSRAVIPGMIAREKGHIVNIGSVAGKQVYENGNVYCTSKAAVDTYQPIHANRPAQTRDQGLRPYIPGR